MQLCGGKNLSVTDRKSLGSSMQKMILATTFCNIGSLVLANILRDSFNILCSISSSQVCKRALEAPIFESETSCLDSRDLNHLKIHH